MLTPTDEWRRRWVGTCLRCWASLRMPESFHVKHAQGYGRSRAGDRITRCNWPAQRTTTPLRQIADAGGWRSARRVHLCQRQTLPSGGAGAPPQAMAGPVPGTTRPCFRCGQPLRAPSRRSRHAYEVAVGRGTGRNRRGPDRDSKQNSMTRTDKKGVRTALHPPSGFAPSPAESRRRVAG